MYLWLYHINNIELFPVVGWLLDTPPQTKCICPSIFFIIIINTQSHWHNDIFPTDDIMFWNFFLHQNLYRILCNSRAQKLNEFHLSRHPSILLIVNRIEYKRCSLGPLTVLDVVMWSIPIEYRRLIALI